MLVFLSHEVVTLFRESGLSVVACFALAAYVVKLVVDNASLLHFKGRGVEGEIRFRARPKK